MGATIRAPGRLAQLGEHQLDKLGVTGSSPVPPTIRKPRSGGVFYAPSVSSVRGSCTSWKPFGNLAIENWKRCRDRFCGVNGGKRREDGLGPVDPSTGLQQRWLGRRSAGTHDP